MLFSREPVPSMLTAMVRNVSIVPGGQYPETDRIAGLTFQKS